MYNMFCRALAYMEKSFKYNLIFFPFLLLLPALNVYIPLGTLYIEVQYCCFFFKMYFPCGRLQENGIKKYENFKLKMTVNNGLKV